MRITFSASFIGVLLLCCAFSSLSRAEPHGYFHLRMKLNKAQGSFLSRRVKGELCLSTRENEDGTCRTVMQLEELVNNFLGDHSSSSPVLINYTFPFASVNQLVISFATSEESDFLPERKKIREYVLPLSIRTFDSRSRIAEADWIAVNQEKLNRSALYGLHIEVVMQCALNYYGHVCATNCIPNKQSSCSRSGERVCISGWKYPKCEVRDPCFQVKCPSECRPMLTDASCECVFSADNGKCYERLCENVTCLNGGACQHTSRPELSERSVECKCPKGFHGPQCELSPPTTTRPPGKTTRPPGKTTSPTGKADRKTTKVPTKINDFFVAFIVLLASLGIGLLVSVFYLCFRRNPSKERQGPPPEEYSPHLYLRANPRPSSTYDDPDGSLYSDISSHLYVMDPFTGNFEAKDMDDYDVARAPYSQDMSPELPPARRPTLSNATSKIQAV